MYNLIVLGCGRSGTSLAMGLFNKAGYFMGDDLYRPDSANPKGYFENPEINFINEEIMSQVLPPRPKGRIGNLFFRKRPGAYQMWLARVPPGASLTCPDAVKERIRTLTARAPFCFKDPRFSYTLPCWQPLIKNTRFLVVFRSPADTAQSIIKVCKEAAYLRTLSISYTEILEVWRLMYSRILNMHRTDGSWTFVHYNQMMDAQYLDRLEAFTDTNVDRAFPEQSLRRSISTKPVPTEESLLYQRLCDLANYAAS